MQGTGSSPEGALRTSQDFELEIAKGNVPGHSLERKFGANTTIGTTEEDIWANGDIYPCPTTCETVRIKTGGNVNDDVAGTGARKVMVYGLGTDWGRINEELTTAGTNASAATPVCFRRVYRLVVTDVGTYTGNNIGDIVLENTSSAQVLANASAGFGQSQLTMFTVAAGETAYLTRIFKNVSGGKAGDLFMWQRRNADIVVAPFTGKRLVRPIYGTDAENEYTVHYGPFPEKTDLWWSGAADTGSTAADVGYDLIIVDN